MTDMTAQLHELATHKFPASRGSEQRIDVYLELNALLRVEDSPALVQALCRALPALLREFHDDLQHATVRDVLHVCLRTLSYFMYHRALAAEFTDTQISTFLSDVVSLLFSTQDETTYKLCLWSLTMQNIDEQRHPCLQRTLEAFVQAIVNPFQSRAIELQAMSGLHVLLRKYPRSVVESDAAVLIWLKPMCSRLTSRHAPTREQARVVLKDASRSASMWSATVAVTLHECMLQYAFPAMKAHVESSRSREALQVWSLTLLLLKASLATDLTLLNEILYIPEGSMRHSDAAIRLLSLDAWQHVVPVFRQSAEWCFKKSVVQLLVRPIVVCLDDEQLETVVHAAFRTWRATVAALVQDFNAFCAHVRAPDAIQAHARKWKRWFDEAVAQPLAAAMARSSRRSGTNTREEHAFSAFAATLWHCDAAPDADHDQTPHHVQFATGADDVASVTIGANLFGLAFILPDVLSLVHRMITHADVTGSADANATAARVDPTWRGVCRRLRPQADEPSTTTKLRLRLLRICLEFAFAVPSGAVTPVASVNGTRASRRDELFGIEWQLRLLEPLLQGLTAAASPSSSDDLRALFTHQKSKLATAMVTRMRRVSAQYPSSAQLLAKWESSDLDQSERVDFAARANVLPCTLLYLLLAYSSVLDTGDRNSRTTSAVHDKLASLRTMHAVVTSVATSLGQGDDERPAHHDEVAQFVVNAIEHGDALLRDSERTDNVLSTDAFLSSCYELCTSSSVVASAPDLASADVIEIVSSASTLSSSDDVLGTPPSSSPSSLAMMNNEHVAASADTSMSSPCLLESGQSSTDPLAGLQTRTLQLPPTTPKRERRSSSRSAGAGPPITPVTPSLLQRSSAPSLMSSTAAPGPLQSTRRTPRDCVFPDLVDSTEPIAQLHRHFPLAFRPFFTFFKIKTIGDLSAMSIDHVKTFGLKEPVVTVTRALEEFSDRKDRLRSIASSPFQQRVQSPAVATTPIRSSGGRPLPSPRRILKRASDLSAARTCSPLPLPSPHRKRARRSLLELSNKLDAIDNSNENGEDEREESERSRRMPKLAERVTFCLPVSDGETRITRPGEDSQDTNTDAQSGSSSRESSDERIETFSLKFVQHLRRSAYYADKLVAEDESWQSDASLQTSASEMHARLRDFQAAHDVLAQMSRQLQVLTETYGARCATMFEAAQPKVDGGSRT